MTGDSINMQSMAAVIAALSETYTDDGIAIWLASTHVAGQFKGERPIDVCKTARGRFRVYTAAYSLGEMIAT